MTEAGVLLRVTELFDAVADRVAQVAQAVVPADVQWRVSQTGAGAYLTLEKRVVRLRALRRLHTIRYLQGVVTEIRSELESPAVMTVAMRQTREPQC
ncbi:MAG: hypothetical protein ACR2KJ_17425 [Jatrophihabitans sp.]